MLASLFIPNISGTCRGYTKIHYKKYVWTIWEAYVESTPFRATENLNALGWTLGDLEGLSWSSLRYKCIFSSSRYVAVTQVAHKIICLRFTAHC